MTAALESIVLPFLEALYAQMGYLGVAIAMTLESACIPIPSELILPMAGWMVSRGVFDFWLAVFFGTAGNTTGSIIAFAVGYYGGRPLLFKYGRYFLVSHHDIELADRWFARYGEWAVFFSRMMPIVRTFISLPAGVTRMSFVKFVIYSTLGAVPWSILLVYLGQLAGDNWLQIRAVMHNFDYLIMVVLVGVAGFFIWHKVKNLRADAKAASKVE